MSQALSVKSPSSRPVEQNMAAVKDRKDTLCLFDVDGTVTPARLVSYILWIVFKGRGNSRERSLRGYFVKGLCK